MRAKVNKRPFAVALGKNIASRRVELNMTQAALAVVIDHSIDSVAGWERGENTPSVAGLVLVAEALSVDPEDLLPASRLAHMEPSRKRGARVPTGVSTHPNALGAKPRPLIAGAPSARDDARNRRAAA